VAATVPAATIVANGSIVDQLVGRGPEVADEPRNAQLVGTTLGQEHTDHVFLWIDPPRRAEGPVPAEAPRSARKIAARGDHAHAESPAVITPVTLEERRSGFLLGRDVVHGHQLDGRPRQ